MAIILRATGSYKGTSLVCLLSQFSDLYTVHSSRHADCYGKLNCVQTSKSLHIIIHKSHIDKLAWCVKCM